MQGHPRLSQRRAQSCQGGVSVLVQNCDDSNHSPILIQGIPEVVRENMSGAVAHIQAVFTTKVRVVLN